MTDREESRIERLILREIGADPDVYLAKNEVGVGYPRRVLDMIETALKARHPEAWAIVERILQRNRIAYGWGVGSPDLMGALGQRLIGLEVKTPTGRLSPEQVTFHAAMRRRGLLVETVRSPEEARAVIEGWRAA